MCKVADKSTKQLAFEFYQTMGLRVEHIEDLSNNALVEMLRQKKSYDLIYVDGFHEKTVPLEDIALSLSLLSEDGVIVIDDWIWPDVAPIKHLLDRHLVKIAEHPLMAAYKRKKTS
jgi:predicted O-methyltransferase YrrM